MRMTVRPLCFAIAAALLSALPCPSLAWAANGDHGDQREHHHGHPDDHRSHGEHERELEEVVVTASRLRCGRSWPAPRWRGRRMAATASSASTTTATPTTIAATASTNASWRRWW